MFRLHRRRGFTLLELIVVIVILGLLAALAIPTFAKVIARSKDSVTEQTLSAIARDAQALHAFNPDAPWSDSSIETAITETSAAAMAGAWAAQLQPVKDTSAAATTPSPGQVVYAVDNTTSTIGLAMNSGDKVCVLAADTTSILAFGCVSSSTDPAQDVIENPSNWTSGQVSAGGDVTGGGTESGGGGVVIPPAAFSFNYATSAFSGASSTVVPTVSGASGATTFSYSGTLPTGVTFDSSSGTFTAPALLPDVTFVQVQLSDHMAVGLTATGDVYGWGENTYATVPGLPNARVMVPTKADFTGLLPAGFVITKIRLIDQVLIVENASGEDRAFGAYTPAPDHILSNSATNGRLLDPSNRLGGPITDVKGTLNSAVWLVNGQVFTTGSDNAGQLGDGPGITSGTENLFSPTSQNYSGNLLYGKTVTAVYATPGNDVYALTDTGYLYAWGSNTNGSLGLASTTTAAYVPFKLASGVEAVSVSQWGGIYQDSNGNLWAWGYNNGGTYGNGTTATVTGSKAVSMTPFGSEKVTSFNYSSQVVTAVTGAGNLYTWGYASNPAGAGFTVPTKLDNAVFGGATPVLTLQSPRIQLVYTSGNGAWTWGLNNYGQIGNGTSSATPVKSPLAATAFGSVDPSWPFTTTVTATDDNNATFSQTITLSLN